MPSLTVLPPPQGMIELQRFFGLAGPDDYALTAFGTKLQQEGLTKAEILELKVSLAQTPTLRVRQVHQICQCGWGC